MRFIFCHHSRGKTNGRYKGGLYLYKADPYGSPRWVIICRDGSRVHYARAVMEAHLKRNLKSEEHVHHIDGNATNDAIENLTILDSITHQKVHHLYSREELLNHLRRFYQEHGRPPRNIDFINDPEYPYPKAYLREFGRWNLALKAAGLPIYRAARWIKSENGQPVPARAVGIE